jgi:hypothetical protein
LPVGRLVGQLQRLGAEPLDADDRDQGFLPAFFVKDFSFYIRQRWIADLLASWYANKSWEKAEALGGSEKITRVMFGRDRKGLPSFDSMMRQRRRDEVLCREIARRLEAGQTYRRAYRDVAEQSKTLTGEKITAGSVRRIHESRLRGEDPLFTKRFT